MKTQNPITRSVVLVLATLWLANWAGSVQAASAEELIRAHYKAIGGVEAHKKINSRVLRGPMELPAQGISATIVIQSKAPDKIRTEVDIPGAGKFTEGFDGKVAWVDNPFLGVIDQPAEQEAVTRRQAHFYRGIELFDHYDTWTVNGNETVRGKRTWVLEGSKDGDKDVFYLDEKTHLIVQIRSSLGGNASTVRFDDYRAVDGVKIPFNIQVDAGASGTVAIRFQEVKHGVDLDDTLFAKPVR